MGAQAARRQFGGDISGGRGGGGVHADIDIADEARTSQHRRQQQRKGLRQRRERERERRRWWQCCERWWKRKRECGAGFHAGGADLRRRRGGGADVRRVLRAEPRVRDARVALFVFLERGGTSWRRQ